MTEKITLQGSTPAPLHNGKDTFRLQLYCMTVFNLAAGAMIFGYPFANGSLIHDNGRLFSLFRDNLHSLNFLGEPQWWDSSAQTGFPSYYLALLGNSQANPIYGLFCMIFWLLGRLGIHFGSYFAFFYFYVGFLIPFLLSLGLLIIFRRIFNKNSVIIFLLLMSSFSPGVVFNLTDYWSMEQTVYAVYFAAALLWFMEEPTEKIFLWLALSLMACSLALSHISLYFNILFIPLFFIAANLFGPLPFTQSVKRLWAAVPWWKWALLWLACAALMTPAYITYLQGSDFTRASIGSRVYEYADLKVGNPLEFLAISTPGIGCAWDGKEKDFILIPATGFLMSYGYMGILSLPLAIFGLVYGKPAWRKRLFILFTIFCTVITLSAYSPIFSLLLAPPTILRSVNHYSDALFRGGGFIILLLAAGLGAEAILGRERSFKKNFWPSTWALRSCQ